MRLPSRPKRCRRARLASAGLSGALLLAGGLLGSRALGQMPGEEEPVPPTKPGVDDTYRPGGTPYDDTYRPGGTPYDDAEEPIRREPAPIPPGRPLPFYPPEPPPAAPPSSAVSAPPDFVGSAQGYLEIPVGQTGTLLARGATRAALRSSKVAAIAARDADGIRVRGIFPGRTLLDVWYGAKQETYIVQVR